MEEVLKGNDSKDTQRDTSDLNSFLDATKSDEKKLMHEVQNNIDMKDSINRNVDACRRQLGKMKEYIEFERIHKFKGTSDEVLLANESIMKRLEYSVQTFEAVVNLIKKNPSLLTKYLDDYLGKFNNVIIKTEHEIFSLSFLEEKNPEEHYKKYIKQLEFDQIDLSQFLQKHLIRGLPTLDKALQSKGIDLNQIDREDQPFYYSGWGLGVRKAISVDINNSITNKVIFEDGDGLYTYSLSNSTTGDAFTVIVDESNKELIKEYLSRPNSEKKDFIDLYTNIFSVLTKPLSSSL